MFMKVVNEEKKRETWLNSIKKQKARLSISPPEKVRLEK